MGDSIGTEIVQDIDFLHKPCNSVAEGQNISEIVAALLSRLKKAGRGLAANQLGVCLRICVIGMPNSAPICLVNPVLVKQKKSVKAEEGCLSLPGVTRVMVRPQEIVVKGLNQYLKPVRYRLGGMMARAACHEIDHLNGKLIIDYKGGNDVGTEEG